MDVLPMHGSLKLVLAGNAPAKKLFCVFDNIVSRISKG